MHVFPGVFPQSAFAGHMTGPYDPSLASDVGQSLVAIKIDLLMSFYSFRGRAEYLYERAMVLRRRVASVESSFLVRLNN